MRGIWHKNQCLQTLSEREVDDGEHRHEIAGVGDILRTQDHCGYSDPYSRPDRGRFGSLFGEKGTP